MFLSKCVVNGIDSDENMLIFVQMCGKWYRFGQKRLLYSNVFLIFAPEWKYQNIQVWIN